MKPELCLAVGWVLLLIGAALGGCVDPIRDPGDRHVPYPAVGDRARYRGESRTDDVTPVHIIAPVGGIAVMVDPETGNQTLTSRTAPRLGPGDRLEVRVEAPKDRWDMFQVDDEVVPLNWTWFHDDRRLPSSPVYVSVAHQDAIRWVHPGWNVTRAIWGMGGTTTFGSNLFWGVDLEVGRTFTRRIGDDTGQHGLEELKDMPRITFRIAGRERVAGRETYRVEVQDPAVLENQYRDRWSDLSFWVSPETPFVVQMEGTYVLETDEGPRRHHRRFVMESFEPGAGPVVETTWDPTDRRWGPRQAELGPWDGFKPPGNGSSFALFPFDAAMDQLRMREPLVAQFLLRHPEAQVTLAEYSESGGEAIWEVVLNEPNESESVRGEVHRRADGSYATDSELRTGGHWVPPRRYDELITFGGCVELWEALTGGPRGTLFKLRYQFPPPDTEGPFPPIAGCGVHTSDQSLGTFAGLFNVIWAYGGIQNIRPMSGWPRR